MRNLIQTMKKTILIQHVLGWSASAPACFNNQHLRAASDISQLGVPPLPSKTWVVSARKKPPSSLVPYSTTKHHIFVNVSRLLRVRIQLVCASTPWPQYPFPRNLGNLLCSFHQALMCKLCQNFMLLYGGPNKATNQPKPCSLQDLQSPTNRGWRYRHVISNSFRPTDNQNRLRSHFMIKILVSFI